MNVLRKTLTCRRNTIENSLLKTPTKHVSHLKTFKKNKTKRNKEGELERERETRVEFSN